MRWPSTTSTGTGAGSSRRIECVAVMLHEPAWYVLAWDLEKDAPRVFRMDRIAHARVGGALVAEPHPLNEVVAQACPDPEAYAGWLGTPIGESLRPS
ncbi:MAG TPA: WYL domain-containing protein [Archangium sp.]